MSLTLYVDTYVSIEQADNYVKSYYRADDPLKSIWDSLQPDDKEVLLRRAFDTLNALPYTGRRLSYKQNLPFPRYGWVSSDWTAVQNAQIEVALQEADTDAGTAMEEATIKRWQSRGVSSIKLGDASYTFGKSSVKGFGLPERAYNFIKKWLSGGYGIC